MAGWHPRSVVPLVLLVAVAAADPALAASWGAITPGETTRRQVETQYGPPSRERIVVEEGRTLPEWTYASERTPRGVTRMVVSFGLFREGAFVPDVVRSLTLYPEPRVFSVRTLTNGWGDPVVTGTEEQTGRKVRRYAGGLLVILDKTGEWAEVMLFAPSP